VLQGCQLVGNHRAQIIGRGWLVQRDDLDADVKKLYDVPTGR